MSPEPTPAADLPERSSQLLAAFRGLRPDPEAFTAGVRERIAELEQRERSRATRFAQAPERLRWAASILPPELVAGAASAAGLAGKKLGFKLLIGTLAAPAITLLVLIGAFSAGVRSLRKQHDGEQGGEGDAEAIARGWWRRNKWPVLVGFGLLLVLALLNRPEIFSALVVLSMLTTVLLLAELARAGLADRERVARTTARLLWSTSFLWWYLRDFLPTEPSGQPNWVGSVVLMLGAAACLHSAGILTWRKIAERVWHPERRMRHPDPVTTFCLRGLYGFSAIVAGAGLILGGWLTVLAFLNLQTSREDLVEYVEEFEAPIDEAVSWYEFPRLVHGLEECGVRPDYSRLGERVRTELAAGRSLDVSTVGPILLELELVTAAEVPEVLAWAEMARSPRSDDYRTPPYLVAARTLFEAGRLSAEERARLADWADADWPGVASYDILREILGRVRLLDALGEKARVEARRDYVFETLLTHWRGLDPDSPSAAFASQPNPETRSFGWRTLVSSDYPATQQALALMLRLGVPPAVDLERVRESLRAGLQKGRLPAMLSEGGRQGRRLVDLTLVQLEVLAPEERGALSFVFQRRSSLGALLFVLLCLFATRRAPTREDLA